MLRWHIAVDRHQLAYKLLVSPSIQKEPHLSSFRLSEKLFSNKAYLNIESRILPHSEGGAAVTAEGRKKYGVICVAELLTDGTAFDSTELR